MHITHPNGTDLTLKVKGRPVGVSDGVISAEDMKAGGAANAVYLPAGEVYTTPVAGTANGKLVNREVVLSRQGDRQPHDGIQGRQDGRRCRAAARASPTSRRSTTRSNDPRKDEFAYVDFGINPNVKLPANASVGNWVPAGTVTVGTGGNTWAGGNNSVPYGQTVSLMGATVTLDGKPVIEGGTLKL